MRQKIEAGRKFTQKNASAYSVVISQYVKWQSLIFEMYVGLLIVGY